MKTQLKSLLRALGAVVLLAAPNPASAYYDPGVQRWINRDPAADAGFLVFPVSESSRAPKGETADYAFLKNDPINRSDGAGLRVTWFGGWRDNDVPPKDRDIYNACMSQFEGRRFCASACATAVGCFATGEALGSVVPGVGNVTLGVIGAVGGFVGGWGTGYYLTTVADTVCKRLAKQLTDIWAGLSASTE